MGNYRRFNRMVLGCCAVALLVCASTASRADFVIDNFTAVDSPSPWPVTVTNFDFRPPVFEAGLSGVVGGVRETRVIPTNFFLPGFDQIDFGISPLGGGVADYETSAGASGIITLRYLGASGLQLDLTGEDFFQIDFAAFNHASGLKMDVLATLTEGSSLAFLEMDLMAAGPQSMIFTLNDFFGIGSLNLSSIDSINFTFSPGPDSDFQIEQIISVPEPASLVLLLFGAAAAFRSRRSRLA